MGCNCILYTQTLCVTNIDRAGPSELEEENWQENLATIQLKVLAIIAQKSDICSCVFFKKSFDIV